MTYDLHQPIQEGRYAEGWGQLQGDNLAVQAMATSSLSRVYSNDEPE